MGPNRSIFCGNKASRGGSSWGERIKITGTVVTTQDRAILEILHRKSKQKTMENEHEDDSSSNQSTSLRINNNNPKTPTYDIQILSRTTQMSDKILSCPRCSSIDTKFSYYNNYNVNQPRHLCKNCQRYWAEGGTKRNTPIGSGRRKNKSVSSKFSYKSEKSKVASTNLVENGGNYGLMNVPKYPVQIPCFPSHPWCHSWNSVCYRPPANLYNSGFRMNFYPIPGYQGCSLQVQQNPLSMLMAMPLMNPNCPLQDKDSETSRVNDSSKARKTRYGRL